MNTYSRRSLLALAGVAALGSVSTRAASNRIGLSGRPLYSCGAVTGTPEIIHIDSDIPFDKAYIDTTIRYHEATLKLVELNRDDLEDERLIEVAEQILKSHPADIEELKSFREEWFDSAEPDEPTKEMMMLSMGGVESCSDESHMNFMDIEWVEETWEKNDDHLFAFVSMMVLSMEMEHHQHMVGLQVAEHAELKDFCQRMHEASEPQIKTLKTVRGELINRY